MEGGPHIGIWALAPIWRKNPYAMIAAVAMISNASLIMVGQEERALEFAKFIGIKNCIQKPPIQYGLMSKYLSKMHLNLYVTLSECTPMLPLESLAAGVPCLIGPNSHLFEDNKYLHSRMVVTYPDRSDIIAEMIKQALEERDQIINEYIKYAPKYITYSQNKLINFLAT
jgi:hypothetical protein